jgi:hypothetical protein
LTQIPIVNDSKNPNLYGFPLKVIHNTYLKRFYSYLNTKYMPPELISQKWELLEEYAYGIGIFINKLRLLWNWNNNI